ncbi:hypothetical protein Tsp_14994 [Trichinella spiralis]|uniref:hypothetical protein n=1 Tax=Trichinella spiralis TaxID=6334 RepID=UPI0001EFDED6|nr:hypothetical protein Tsp_14994 [Trichinella spiralis]
MGVLAILPFADPTRGVFQNTVTNADNIKECYVDCHKLKKHQQLFPFVPFIAFALLASSKSLLDEALYYSRHTHTNTNTKKAQQHAYCIYEILMCNAHFLTD